MSDQFQIDTDVPPPAPSQNRGISETLGKLKVGDSFVAPTTARPNIYTFAKRQGIKIRTKKETDDTFRVWRVEGTPDADTDGDNSGDS